MEFEPLLQAVGLCGLSRPGGDSPFYKRLLDVAITSIFIVCIVFVFAEIVSTPEDLSNNATFVVAIAASFLYFINLRFLFNGSSSTLGSWIRRFNGRSLFNNKEFLMKELAMRQATRKSAKKMACVLYAVMIFRTSVAIIIMSLSDLEVPQSIQKLTTVFNTTFWSLVFKICFIFASTVGFGTIISCTLLFTCVVKALADRARYLAEIAPTAFKKYRNVPDYSVLFQKWLARYDRLISLIVQTNGLLQSMFVISHVSSFLRMFDLVYTIFFVSPFAWVKLPLSLEAFVIVYITCDAGERALVEVENLRATAERLALGRAVEPNAEIPDEWNDLARGFRKKQRDASWRSWLHGIVPMQLSHRLFKAEMLILVVVLIATGLGKLVYFLYVG